MRYVLISVVMLSTAASGPAATPSGPAKAGRYVSGPAEAGRYFSDIASGFSQTQETQIIEITAERFSFNPSEIRVKAGTKLEIRLTSEDTMHGFHIVGTDIDLELPKRGRGVASVTFQPTAGRYEFQCSQLCGAGHSFMRGVIIAAE